MHTRFYTYAELEAASICRAAGCITTGRTNSSDEVKNAANFIIQLAESIKNERANATLEFAANASIK